MGRLVLVSWLALALLAPPPAAAQLDTSAIQVQGAVDGVARALIEGIPAPRESLLPEVVSSDAYFAGAGGGRATVTTRFLREAAPAAQARYELAVSAYRGLQ